MARTGLREEMTRYVASIDEKVEIPSIDLRLTKQFRERLFNTG